MLWEFFQYVVTPCDASVQRLGGLTEFIGIRARYGRCREAWRPHLQRCQEVILESSAQCTTRGVALILGSGWLLDIPLEALSKNFERVILVDWIHPWPVRWRASHLGNVTCCSADLSGVAAATVEWSGGPLPSLTPPQLPQADFVVSANVMTQLPILVKDWIESRSLTERNSDRFKASLKSWSRLILENHWNQVRSLASVGCLITDLEEKTATSLGEVKEVYDPLEGLILPSPDLCWNWELSPRGEIDSKQQILHRVGLWRWP